MKDFPAAGIVQINHNLEASMRSFARACFTYALSEKIDVWFSTKDTISKKYDAGFRDVFEREFAEHWKDRFAGRASNTSLRSSTTQSRAS